LINIHAESFWKWICRKATTIRWIGRLVRVTWLPFGVAIGGRWAASGLEMLASSLVAFAVIRLGGTNEERCQSLI